MPNTGSTPVGKIHVDIGADLSNLKKGLDEAEKQTKKTAKSIGDKMTAMGKSMSKAGKLMTLGITVPLLGVGAAVTKMAMEAEESENLFEVSMGNMAESARKWSEQLREDLGLNAVETRKMISTFNVMLDSMGLGTQEAFDMSKGMTQLSYDMASFYNLKPEEAFLKLQAGITGEAEQLKRLGIIINEATIKTVAYENGIAELGAELTDQEKVQARYIAIMEQTSKAQGDLARTIESPTNQLRILGAELKTAGEEFGAVLIPALQEGIKFLREITGWLANLSTEQKENIVKWAAFAAAIGPVLLIAGKILIVLPKLVTGFKLMQPVLLAMKTNLMALFANPVVLGLALLAAAITTIIVSAKKGREAVAAAIEETEARHMNALAEMGKAAADAVRAEYDEKITFLQKGAKATEQAHIDELAAIDKWGEKQLQARIDGLERRKAIEKEAYDATIRALDDEYGTFKKNTASKMDLVDEFYDHEIAKANEAYNIKIDLLNKELDATKSRIDRESSLAIGSIEDQLALLEGATDEEIRENERARFAEEAIRLEDLIAAEQDAEARQKLITEREGYISEAIARATDENLEKQKWALRELIVEEKIKGEERKLEAAAINQAMLDDLKRRVDNEIIELEAKRESEKQILQDEKLEKQRIETEKFNAAQQSIDDQITALGEGSADYNKILNREMESKRFAENQKYLATKESVDNQIAELQRLSEVEAAIAEAKAIKEGEASDAMQKKNLLDLYQTTNEKYQEAIAAMGDDGLIGRTWKTLTGGYRAELAPIEREMEKIANQLKALGVPGFASGGVIDRPTLAMVGESGPEMIIPQDRFNEVIAAANRSAQGAGAGGVNQVEHRHSGEIKVTGVDDSGQLVEVIDVKIKETLRQEARAYG